MSRLALCAAALLMVSFATAYAQVEVSSTSLDNTIIAGLYNGAALPISTVNLWLSEGESFVSFKATGSWTGIRPAENLITFSTSVPLPVGEVVRFGVETAAPVDGINWQALDAVGTELGRDKSIPVVKVPENPDQPGDPTIPGGPAVALGIIDGAEFRIIPSSPNVGSTIRIAGEGFAQGHDLTLLLGSRNLSSTSTGEGNFVHTMTLPDDITSGRVDFKLIDGSGGTLEKSVRIGDARSRMTQIISEGLDLTSEVPATVLGGEAVTISGIGHPGSVILVTLRHPDGYAISINQLRIDSDGGWSESFNIPSSASAGRYSVVITDGATDIKRSWDVESGRIIRVTSEQLYYDPGQLLEFKGTAKPDTDLEVRLSNPQNIILYENVFSVPSNGFVEFSVETRTGYPKGTYVLLLKQGTQEIVEAVGLGGAPDEPFVVKMDSINYSTGDMPEITVFGKPNTPATLSVVDTVSHDTKDTFTITINADGFYTQTLDISEYQREIYTTTVSRGKNSAEIDFGVNIPDNTGGMSLSTIKSVYMPVEPIIVLGQSEKPESLVEVVLVDPSGTEIKSHQTFTSSEKTGKKKGDFSAAFSAVFFVYADSEPGTWKVISRSGQNTAETSFELITMASTGIILEIEVIDDVLGKSVIIRGEGAPQKQRIEVSISHERGEVVQTMSALSSSSGSFNTEWPNSDDLPPGKYTITVTDLERNESEITYVVPR